MKTCPSSSRHPYTSGTGTVSGSNWRKARRHWPSAIVISSPYFTNKPRSSHITGGGRLLNHAFLLVALAISLTFSGDGRVRDFPWFRKNEESWKVIFRSNGSCEGLILEALAFIVSKWLKEDAWVFWGWCALQHGFGIDRIIRSCRVSRL